jgi:hypothetical protein
MQRATKIVARWPGATRERADDPPVGGPLNFHGPRRVNRGVEVANLGAVAIMAASGPKIRGKFAAARSRFGPGRHSCSMPTRTRDAGVWPRLKEYRTTLRP